MLLNTFWSLTVGEHTNMNASVYITDLCPWAGKFISSFFVCDIFWLQIFYSISPNKVSSSIEFLLITSFIHPITELPQIYVKQNVPKLTRMKPELFLRSYSSPPLLLQIRRTGFQLSSVDRRPGRKQRPFLFCRSAWEHHALFKLSCHHKKDAFVWLLLFYTVLAYGEYFFSLIGK